MADKDPNNSTSEVEEKSTAEPAGTSQQSSTPKEPKATKGSGAKTKSKATGNKSSGKKAFKAFKFLLFLVILAALAASSWYLYKYLESEFSATDSQLQASNQQIADLAQLISTTQQSQQNIERGLTNFVADQQRQMQALAERVRTAEGVRDGDWILAEAQYLLRLADQRLLISRDTESAVELLEAADELLRELAYPELVAVRQALSSDIASLRAAPSVDYQGIYFQILATGREIDSLQLKSVETFVSDSDAVSPQDAMGIWASTVNSLKAALSELIVIRKTTDSADWLVDAEGEAALRGQIDLLILQSLSALLSGDQNIYSSALESVVNLLQVNFQDNTQRQAVESSFADFSTQSILAEVPDLSASLRAMEYGAELLRRLDQGD